MMLLFLLLFLSPPPFVVCFRFGDGGVVLVNFFVVLFMIPQILHNHSHALVIGFQTSISG